MNNEKAIDVQEIVGQVAIILLGLSLALSAEKLVDQIPDDISWVSILNFITLFVLVILWLHAEMAYGNFEPYTSDVNGGSSSNSIMLVVEFWLDIVNLMIPLFLALFIDNSRLFSLFLMLVFLTDMILALFSWFRENKIRDEGNENEIRGYLDEDSLLMIKTNKRWVLINFLSFSITFWFCVAFWTDFSQTGSILFSLVVLLIVVIQTVLDYVLNQRFYFGKA